MTAQNESNRLPVIKAELTQVLKRIEAVADIVQAGKLLIEAQEQVGHGKWLEWLDDNFSMSNRTAAKYQMVAAWAVKFAPQCEFDKLNLSANALYWLADDSMHGLVHQEPEDARQAGVDAVLKAAREKRVGQEAAMMIENEILAGFEDAKRTRHLRWKAANPEAAKQQAREARIMQYAADDLYRAQPLADGKKDAWLARWIKKNWTAENEAEFQADWEAHDRTQDFETWCGHRDFQTEKADEAAIEKLAVRELPEPQVIEPPSSAENFESEQIRLARELAKQIQEILHGARRDITGITALQIAEGMVQWVRHHYKDFRQSQITSVH